MCSSFKTLNAFLSKILSHGWIYSDVLPFVFSYFYRNITVLPSPFPSVFPSGLPLMLLSALPSAFPSVVASSLPSVLSYVFSSALQLSLLLFLLQFFLLSFLLNLLMYLHLNFFCPSFWACICPTLSQSLCLSFSSFFSFEHSSILASTHLTVFPSAFHFYFLLPFLMSCLLSLSVFLSPSFLFLYSFLIMNVKVALKISNLAQNWKNGIIFIYLFSL